MVEISVVIITYKRPLEVLERAIKSVLNQSFKNIELLVVNDAPEEKELSIEIAKMIGCLNDSRVRYLTYDKNRGSNYARNFGLKNSVGRYIAYLDDDDEWLPIKLEKQFETIVKNPDIALVACGFNILNERGKCGEKKVIGVLNDPKQTFDIININIPMPKNITGHITATSPLSTQIKNLI